MAVNRSGVLAGVAAAGFVRVCQASEVWPLSPPGEVATAIKSATSTPARPPSRARPASFRVRGAGGRCGGEEGCRQPGHQQQGGQQQEQRAELVPRVRTSGQRNLVGRQRVARERPRHHRCGRDARRQQRRHRPQPQRHDREPEHQPERERQQAAARIGQHQADEQDPQPRPCERVDDRRAGAPRGDPQERRHAERRHQPDRVPVAERLAQAGERLVGRQRLGEDLGGQRPPADEHAAQPDPAQDRRPAPRHEPHQRQRARERRHVGERPARLEPRVGRRQRPR